jgi:prophage DNA circulation protein
MAWKDTLLDASFRGVRFDVINIKRSGGRAIVVNEYPYAAGADLDDLNLHPRRFNLKAIVYGEDYEGALRQLIDALDAPGAAELVHPIHGSVQAMAESWDDEHDAELVDGAMLNISFIEHTIRKLVFTATSASAKADAIAAQSANARAVADESLVRRVEDAQGAGQLRLSALKDGLNQAQAALAKLLNTTPLRAVLSDLDPVLHPRSYVADMLAVVDRALQGLPFGGRNLLFDTSSGVAFTQGSGLADFKLAAKQINPAAVVVGPSVAVVDANITSDMAVVQAHAQVHAACTTADSAVIVLAAEMQTPLLDRADIEALANQVRTAVQVAIDGARLALDAEGRGQVGTALRAVAYAVQEAALAVINQRPPLVRRASPIGGPVRLVAHQMYGDASRANEISRLNSLGRHVFIERGEALNVYAV